MKKIKYILLITSVIFIAGCNEDIEFADLNVEILAGKYVAFSVDGANNTISDVEVDEEGNDEDGDPVTNSDGFIALNVEVPTGSTSNVTINYSLGGTAVFGTDYTISGATSAGGSIVIVPDPGDDPADLIDNADIEVTLLTDGIGDGEKIIEITLTSATNSEGEISVGRAGKDILKTHNVIISDVDYVSFPQEALTVQENVGTVKLTIEAYPGAVRTNDITADYSLSGTAIYGVDYTITGATATGGTVIIPAPATVPEDGDPVTFDLEVEILTDSAEDGDKTIIVTLDSADDGSPLSVGIGGNDAGQTSTITISDAANSIVFDTTSESIDVDETDGTTDITFELHAGDDTLTDVTVDYTLGGTAVYGIDYTITGATVDGGSVVITPNSPPSGVPTTLDLQVQILTDDVSDGGKTIVVTIDSATLADTTELAIGIDGAGTTSTITIADADFVSFDENSLEIEVDEDAGSVNVVLEALTNVDINLNYSLGGTAIYGVDYTITGATSTGGSTTINPGVPGVKSTIDLDIQLLTDATADGDKTITITIDNASQANGTPFTVNEGTSTVTIKDID